ncbi:D-arabinose 1-dehydrogenase-like Zn-dependent alcohol dehydrogenase [Arthrobacter sp. UYP6]|uniref:alcohol dehydrogenase catalytic domain-containing protein n=1 Tax=Arthrobacter sp. UYP6 TaxID=1756378 RepID=UPI0033916CCE
MPLFFALPRTMGHENAGVITEVGEGIEHWKVGDRVGLAPVMRDGDALGYGKWDGGFGPKLLATDDNLVKLPDEVLSTKGSKSGTKEDLEALYELMKSGKLNPPMNIVTPAEIPGAIDQLRAGGVVGRFIAVY